MAGGASAQRVRRHGARSILVVLVAFVMAPTLALLAPTQAHAYAEGTSVRIGAKTAASVGTKLAPLRLVTAVTPAGLIVNSIAVVAGLWLTTESGQRVSAEAWAWIKGQADRPGDIPQPSTYYEPTGCRYNFNPLPSFTGQHASSYTITAEQLRVDAGLPEGDCVKYSPSLNSGSIYARCQMLEEYSLWKKGQVIDVAGTESVGTYSGNPCPHGSYAQLLGYSVIGGQPTSGAQTVTGNWGGAFLGWFPNPYAVPVNSTGTIQLSIEKHCQAEDGSVVIVKATGAPDSDVVPFVECPPGTVPIKQEVYSGSTATPDRTLLSTYSVGGQDEYALCVGPGAVGCSMSVYVDGVECIAGRQDCAYWWEIAQSTPERTYCLWGPYSLPAADCEPLRYAYVTEHGAVADPARDPAMMPVPATDPAGTPWPATEPLPDKAPAPEPTTSPDPTTSPEPTSEPSPTSSAGSEGLPSSGTNPAPAPGGDPAFAPDSRTQECFAQMWTWNPVDWVFVPVKCALQWAFVPREATTRSVMAGIESSVEAGPIGAWTAAIEPYGAAFSVADGGCKGPALVLGFPFERTIYPADACSAPMSTLANVSLLGLTAILWIGGSWTCLALISAGFGYQMPGGGDDK
jgi:hypothetical protein